MGVDKTPPHPTLSSVLEERGIDAGEGLRVRSVLEMGRLRMRRRHWRQASDGNIGGGWVKPRRSAHASSSERELIPPLLQKAGADIAVHAVADPYPSPAARTAGYHD